MRILSARIFSKFFGGKNKNFQKEYMKEKRVFFFFFSKLARAYFWRPYFFPKSFGGKIKHGQTDVKTERTLTKKY